MSYLTYALHQGEGFVVVTGEVGAGKTTLVSYLQRTLAGERLFVARITAGQIGPRDLLVLVAKALELPIESADAGMLLAAIERNLRERRRRRQRVLLIVDEVQNLPPESLEQLRVLTNLEEEGRPLLQIVLVGQPQFREMLARPELEQLRQRVVASCHLGPLEEDEVQAYVEHRLRKVGWSGDPLIDLAAYREIYRATGGLPRRINLLCSRLLVYGALEGLHRLGAEDVRIVETELAEEQTPAEPVAAEEGMGGPPSGYGAHPAAPRAETAATARAEAAAAIAMDDSPAYWRREVDRLQRKLESLYEEVVRERHRYDAAREEAIRLREELHRREVEQLRIDAETARRLAELLSNVADMRKKGVFARLRGKG
jgi:type II secretory pathway predicted ATPase ExeA